MILLVFPLEHLNFTFWVFEDLSTSGELVSTWLFHSFVDSHKRHCCFKGEEQSIAGLLHIHYRATQRTEGREELQDARLVGTCQTKGLLVEKKSCTLVHLINTSLAFTTYIDSD